MKLRITTPGRTFEVAAPNDSFTVGSDSDNAIRIEDDPAIAGRHARIERFMDRWSFADQFTSSGTLHNGEKKYSNELAEGDVLTLGGTRIEVLATGAKAADPSPFAPTPTDYTPEPPTVPERAFTTNTTGFTTQSQFGSGPLMHEDLSEDDLDDPLFQAYMKQLVAGRSLNQDELLELQLKAHELTTQTRDRMSDDVIERELLPRMRGENPASDNPREINEQQNRAKTPESHVRRIAGWALAEFAGQTGHRDKLDRAAEQRLNEAAERAVIELQNATSTEINLPFLVTGPSGPLHLRANLQRKHLHHEPGAIDPAGPRPVNQQGKQAHQQPAFAAHQQKSRKANSKPGAIIAGVIVAVVAMFIVFGAISDSIDEAEPVTPGETQSATGKDNSALRSELAKMISDVSRDNQRTAEQRLEVMDAIEMQADRENIDLDYQLKSARDYLLRLQYSALSLEFNRVSGGVYNLRELGKLVEADAMRFAFEKHYTDDFNRANAAKTMEADKWNERAKAEIAAANHELLDKRLREADEALDLREYAKAAEAIEFLRENAIVESLDRTWLKTEAEAWRAVAELQATGKADPPLPKPARKPRPPATPRNTLYPLGGTSASRLLTAVRERTLQMLRDGIMTDVTTTVRGHTAVANGQSRNSLVKLVVSRHYLRDPKMKRTLSFKVEIVFGNLPAETQLGIMLAMPDASLDHLLGMLHLCFENHLSDQAGALAARIRAEYPQSKADLDEVLAAKWETPVPEGGFPERDGRVVRE